MSFLEEFATDQMHGADVGSVLSYYIDIAKRGYYQGQAAQLMETAPKVGKAYGDGTESWKGAEETLILYPFTSGKSETAFYLVLVCVVAFGVVLPVIFLFFSVSFYRF